MHSPAQQSIIDLWPTGRMPGKPATEPEGEQPAKGDNVQRITNVSHSTFALYAAPNATGPSPAVIVCPGGGYSILAYNLEGTEVAEWLNSIGITALVLKYRVPDNRDGAFADIERALRLVRSRHQELNIDPNRLGVLGFSAGGHLCASVSTNPDVAAYKAIDAADHLSCRPDFVVLVYPAYLEEKGTVAHDLPITSKVPPTLIVHAQDDAKYVAGSKVYYAALQAAKVSSELLIFPTGGHGHGLRSDKAVSVWPAKCQAWLDRIGMRGSAESGQQSSDAMASAVTRSQDEG